MIAGALSGAVKIGVGGAGGLHPAAWTFGGLQFETPFFLIVAVVLSAVAYWLGRRSLSGLGPVTRWVALLLRVIVIALLLGALAEPSLRREGKDVSVIAVLDASQSVPTSMQERADAFLEQARAASTESPTDRLGTVTVTRDALVQQIPSDLAQLVERQNVGAPDGSNLAGGVRLALAIRPQDTASRLVLITDGNETTGSLLQAAEAAKAAGVPIDVYPLRYRYDSEVMIDRVTAPATARQGESINVRVVLESTGVSSGRLNLLLNKQPVDLDPDSDAMGMQVELKPGPNVFSVPVLALRHGPQEFEAIFEPESQGGRALGDAIAQNNRASSVTFVSGEGTVLMISSDERESQALEQALVGAGIAIERLSAEAAPKTMVEFSGYDAVILVNQSASDLTQQQQEELKRYVYDGGGGLLMVGGDSSFGAGGWIGSTLEDALPVKLDPPQKRQMPKGALAIITHSVEMPDGVFYGKKTAEAAVGALSREDLAGIVEYRWRGQTSWVHPLSRVGDGSSIRRSIQSLEFGDMPDFSPSMELALAGLQKAEAGQKHMIMISDGDPSPPSAALLQKYREAKISISTIGVYPHSGFDTTKMSEISQATGGRHYHIDTQQALATLPQIFIKEAQTVKRALIWEGDPFAPTIVGGIGDTMRGIGGVPRIGGYVVAADREGLSQVTLRGKENDPIAAQWFYGLGRVGVFTSDASTKWASEWVNWGGFRQFWEQQTRWIMKPSGSINARVVTQTQGDETLIIADLLDAQGERMNFVGMRGKLSGPDGSSVDVEMKQTGPGRYEAWVPTALAGTYVATLRYAGPGNGGSVIEGTVQAAISKPFADEYRSLVDNAPLLEQVRVLTGGRVLSGDPAAARLWTREGLTMPVALTPVWQWAVLAAVVVFLTDVGIRRVRVDVLALLAAARKGLQKSKSSAGEQMGGLRAAREKAQATMAERGRSGGGGTAASGAAGGGVAGGEAARPVVPKSVASVKFEADEQRIKSGKTDVTIGDGSAPMTKPVKPASGEPKPGEKPGDAGEGMSALLKAKKKARDEMNE